MMKKERNEFDDQDPARCRLLHSAVNVGRNGRGCNCRDLRAVVREERTLILGRILNWDDELPNPVIPDFEKKTGIKVKTTPFSQNEEQINKLQAAGGEGFDLCQPTRDRALQFKDIGVLAPFDTNKLHLDNLVPAMLEGSASVWTWDGKLYHLPHCWGSEAIFHGART